MARTKTELQVFVAAPSDVADDKEAFELVIKELNLTWGRQLGIQLTLLAWETDAYPSVGADTQSIINQQIGDEYDIFVGLMWSKFGQPTGRYGSGTEEEFERAFSRHSKDKNSARVMFYFKEALLSPLSINPEQLAKVNTFRSSLESKGVLYWKYTDKDQLENLFRIHLSKVIQEWQTNSLVKAIPSEEKHFPIPTDEVPENSLDLEDEVGLFDLLESGTEAMEICSASVARCGAALVAFTEKTDDRQQYTNKISTLPSDQRVSTARKHADGFAQDMQELAAIFESETPIMASSCKKGFRDLTEAALLKATFDSDSSEIDESIVSIDGFCDILDSVIPKIEGLYNDAIGFPPLSKKTNKSKRALAKALVYFNTELANAKSLGIQISRGLQARTLSGSFTPKGDQEAVTLETIGIPQSAEHKTQENTPIGVV